MEHWIPNRGNKTWSFVSPLKSQGLTPFSRALHSPSYFFPQSQSHLWMWTQSASPAAGWGVRDSQSSDSTLHPRKLRFGEMRSLSKGQTSSECLRPAPIVFLLVHLHPSWHAGPSCVGQEDSHILGVVLYTATSSSFIAALHIMIHGSFQRS